MLKKDNEQLDESSAADSLRPGGAPGESKSQMLATFTALLAQLGTEDLSHFLNDAMAQIGQEAANIPAGAAAKNAASIATKEDLDLAFAGDELSEEFREKASVIFEAAIESRMIVERQAMEEAYEVNLQEEVEAVKQELVEKLDQYLEYSATQWIEENRIAIEQSIRTDIAEGFMQGLHKLFVENYINVPQEQVDVVGELHAKVEQLEAELEESVNTQLELQAIISEAEKETAFDDVCEGLVATQVEKMRTLSEGIEFGDVDSYRRKLEIVREKYFQAAPTASTNIISEEATTVIDQEQPVPAEMDRYIKAISRSLK